MAADEVWCRVTVYAPDGSALRSATVRGHGSPGLETVDRLARMQLEADRDGGRVAITEVSPGLDELLALAGLDRLRGQVRG